ncbi:nucleotide-binding domain-containing protein, partial [Panaeolus papilionaceus]
GVIGLTTALRIQEQPGYEVTIIADHFPTDTERKATYASQWAGAHHVSVAGTDKFQREIDLETFQTMWELSEEDGKAPECFMRLPQIEYYRDQRTHDTLKFMPGFKELTPDQLTVPNALSGLTYNSVNTFVPPFNNYLLSRFLSAGGHIICAHIQHIDQILEHGPAVFASPGELEAETPRTPDAVVVCAGLGARTLGGVEDTSVYPARGQTLLVHAPWLDTCISLSGGEEGLWTYVIPRKNGDAILGGRMRLMIGSYPLPRPHTTTDILTRTLELCPALAPPSIRAVRKPTIEDIRPLIISENCGFRPCRKGGVRLEVEQRRFKGTRVPVIHNCGHGGFGFIASFGSASVVLKLLKQALEEPADN